MLVTFICRKKKKITQNKLNFWKHKRKECGLNSFQAMTPSVPADSEHVPQMRVCCGEGGLSCQLRKFWCL